MKNYIVSNLSYYIAALVFGTVLCMVIPNSTLIGIILTWLLAEIKRYLDFVKSKKSRGKNYGDSNVIENEEFKTQMKELSTGTNSFFEADDSSDAKSFSPSKQRIKPIKNVLTLMLVCLLLLFLAWAVVNLIYYCTNR
ncbi:MAG: hypothetical protein P1U56_23660 [Saprospiraceae bacterium]|nr:hypothetical protein [Saprospiraceae bacterium]